MHQNEQKQPEQPIEFDNLNQLDWWELKPIAFEEVNTITKTKLMEALLVAFPLEEGENYQGSLANHYRGRLKYEGKDSLIGQMCNSGMRKLIRTLRK
jgi:hypothetical protein